ncbi:MAG TPA: hypothetical protein VLH77_06590, partial [Gammaproteobacteria bacterium]|nr:hypothetical protein [Gammaproteobacteria bacterium]
SWLERVTDNDEVGGSSPSSPTIVMRQTYGTITPQNKFCRDPGFSHRSSAKPTLKGELTALFPLDKMWGNSSAG